MANDTLPSHIPAPANPPTGLSSARQAALPVQQPDTAAVAQALAEDAPSEGFTVITTGRQPVDVSMDGKRVEMIFGGRQPVYFDRFQAEAMVNGLMHLLQPKEF
jgi:hypothetical protein